MFDPSVEAEKPQLQSKGKGKQSAALSSGPDGRSSGSGGGGDVCDHIEREIGADGRVSYADAGTPLPQHPSATPAQVAAEVRACAAALSPQRGGQGSAAGPNTRP